MTPQDTRAPQRQQRWVEAANASSETIPAFSIVEVIQSTRPEMGSALTPGGGRTVLQVRKPTDGLKYPIVVNGMLDIRGTGNETHGKATNDFPTYARYDTSEIPVAGEEWGPKAGSFLLHKGGKGFLILGDFDAILGIVRVMRAGASSLIRFKLKDVLPLGGKSRAIEVKTSPNFEEVGEEFPIKDPTIEPGRWREDLLSHENGAGYVGWCLIPANPEFDEDGEPFREIVDMEWIARSINFTLLSDMGGGQATAQVTEWYFGKDPSLAFEPPFVVHDPQNLFPRALQGANGMARYNDKEHRYEIVACDQMARALKAILTSPMCGNTASVAVAEKISWSPYGQLPNPLPTTARNPYLQYAPAGTSVRLEFNDQVEQWEVETVTPVVREMVREIVVGDCGASYKWYRAAVQACNDEEFTEAFLASVRTKVMKSLYLYGCSIYANMAEICSYGPLSESADPQLHMVPQDVVIEVTGSRADSTEESGSDEDQCVVQLHKTKLSLCTLQPDPPTLTLEDSVLFKARPMRVVQNTRLNGTCFEQYVGMGYVICTEDSEWEQAFCGTECPEESGSGGG